VRAASIRERVALLFPGALGDLLLVLPTLRALRARHAGAHVTLAVRAPLRALVALTGLADADAVLDGPDLARLLGGGPPPAWLAGATVYTWLGATDPTVRQRIGDVAAAAHFLRVERGDADVHAAVAYARAAGVPDDPDALAAAARMEMPSAAYAAGRRNDLTPPLLVLHPGAGAPAKRWERAGFAELAGWWRASGGTALALFGPVEAGDPPLEGAVEMRDGTLPDVAAVLARSTLYVGNDSGISHLAAAVGGRGVVLFGATDPARWRPLGDCLRALRGSATSLDGIPREALPAARVIAVCHELQTRNFAPLSSPHAARSP
jgi:hypothetical protein